MIERLTPVADGGKGPEILRPAGDLASPQAGCSSQISSNRMFEIGSRAPWAGMRPAGAVLHRLARPQAPQPDVAGLSADAVALAKLRYVLPFKLCQPAEFQIFVRNRPRPLEPFLVRLKHSAGAGFRQGKGDWRRAYPLVRPSRSPLPWRKDARPTGRTASPCEAMGAPGDFKSCRFAMQICGRVG
jgi:hypothetical protein